ncbi:alpha/beta-hydrolases superfamily protein [Anaeramoeba flamelloides]|uniref:Alpha/beta-hydrolases superfamily protein n=1 Tax=Anaeramoeba flamelloides TaxID=1746091 RepID=A0AAV8AG44_9EUKA|nr:alpha/beta-hydrolases superfamily protein [Anaeramoeba flamelloides]
MGIVVGKLVFRPPTKVKLLEGENLFWTTTKKNHKIPILKFTPEDSYEEEYNLVKVKYFGSSSNEGSDFDLDNNRWSLSPEEGDENKSKNNLESSEEIGNKKETKNNTTTQNNDKQKPLKSNEKKSEEVEKDKKDEKIQSRKRLTVIFAHGNGESISELDHYAIRIAKKTNCDIYLFEYPGFPQTEGKTREKNCYLSAEAVYNWVTKEKKVPAEEIIWFGHSLGTAVVLEMATKYPCGGVFLMSPILSIFRVVMKLACNLPLDKFVNVKKAPKVKSPVMVIHGTDDSVVSINHGKKLYNLFPKKFDGVWIKNGKHNNIETQFRDKFYNQFNRFIDYIVSQIPNKKKPNNSNKKEEIIKRLNEFKNDRSLDFSFYSHSDSDSDTNSLTMGDDNTDSNFSERGTKNTSKRLGVDLSDSRKENSSSESSSVSSVCSSLQPITQNNFNKLSSSSSFTSSLTTSSNENMITDSDLIESFCLNIKNDLKSNDFKKEKTFTKKKKKKLKSKKNKKKSKSKKKKQKSKSKKKKQKKKSKKKKQKKKSKSKII